MLVIARHGRTLSNASGLLLGRADPELDDLGRRQADALGAALGSVDLVVSSPLRRTRETARSIDGPIRLDERFLELDYGEWDQRPLSAVGADEWAAWQADLDFAPPGGESLRQLGERVRSGLDDLVDAATAGTVVVVTHVSPVKAAVAWTLAVDDRVSWRMFVAPASITRIDLGRGRPSLHCFNDVSHLG